MRPNLALTLMLLMLAAMVINTFAAQTKGDDAGDGDVWTDKGIDITQGR